MRIRIGFVSSQHEVDAITIRRARTEEAAALADLHLRSALTGFAHIFPPDAPPPDRSELCAGWADVVPSPNELAACFVAGATGSGIAGVVIGGPDPHEPERGHLSRLYVEPARWGQGIGRALHDTALAHLQAAGFRTASLSVLEHNTRARSWYERLGWRPTDQRIPV
jgi:ribosomal protein S18 acetylase RimI-like enzyme